jgi:uncharacterized protein YutE (UPF0331/DUF86 family)
MPKRKSQAQLRKEVVAHLEDLPRQLLALETAMEKFGEGFELSKFKPAFEGDAGSEAYNQVQAVERGFARVQNYIAQLAQNGARLAGLELPKIHESEAARAFEALKEAGAIEASLCSRLKRLQKVRAAVEHEYLRVKAGPLHQAVELLAASVRDFVGPYTAWIETYL